MQKKNLKLTLRLLNEEDRQRKKLADQLKKLQVNLEQEKELQEALLCYLEENHRLRLHQGR